MEDEEEVAEPFKVFVSRIPLHWTEQLFEEHFVTLAFGRGKTSGTIHFISWHW